MTFRRNSCYSRMMKNWLEVLRVSPRGTDLLSTDKGSLEDNINPCKPVADDKCFLLLSCRKMELAFFLLLLLAHLTEMSAGLCSLVLFYSHFEVIDPSK